MNLCILILTALTERRDWLIHRLLFLEYAGYRGDVIVGVRDGHDQINFVKQVCDQFLRNVNLMLVPQNGDEFLIQRMEQLVRLTDSYYIVIQGDDDFIMPSTLSAAVEILDRDQSIFCAHGRYVNLNLTPLPENYSFFGHPMWEALESEPLERFANLMKHYSFLWHAVYRTKDFSDRIKYMSEMYNSSKDNSFFETMGDVYSVIRGKIFVIDQLYMIRGEHDNNCSKTFRRGGIKYDIPPYLLLSENFSKSYKVFEGLCLRLFDSVGVDVRDESVMRRIADGMMSCFGRLFYKIRDRFDPSEIEFQNKCRAGLVPELGKYFRLIKKTYFISAEAIDRLESNRNLLVDGNG